MGGKDSNYQIVYRGETLDVYVPGGWVFFQRPRACGGGYWLGRTYDCVFMLEFERPVSLHEGLKFIVLSDYVGKRSHIFDDHFSLSSPDSG